MESDGGGRRNSEKNGGIPQKKPRNSRRKNPAKNPAIPAENKKKNPVIPAKAGIHFYRQTRAFISFSTKKCAGIPKLIALNGFPPKCNKGINSPSCCAGVRNCRRGVGRFPPGAKAANRDLPFAAPICSTPPRCCGRPGSLTYHFMPNAFSIFANGRIPNRHRFRVHRQTAKNPLRGNSATKTIAHNRSRGHHGIPTSQSRIVRGIHNRRTTAIGAIIANRGRLR